MDGWNRWVHYGERWMNERMNGCAQVQELMDDRMDKWMMDNTKKSPKKWRPRRNLETSELL